MLPGNSRTAHYRGLSGATGKLYELAFSIIERAAEAKQQGRKIVGVVGSWGELAPLVYAAGAYAVDINELGRFAGGEFLDLVEKELHVPRDTCPMVKGALGIVHSGRVQPDLIVAYAGAACEAYNAGMELLRLKGHPIHQVDIPYRRGRKAAAETRLPAFSSTAKESLVDGLREISLLINPNFKVTELSLEIKRLNRCRQTVRGILAKCCAKPHAAGSLTALMLVNGTNFYYHDPDAFFDICKELEAEIDSCDSKTSVKTVPILWSGARGQDLSLYELVDSAGARVAAWNIPSNFHRDLREDVDPFEALAIDFLDSAFFGDVEYSLETIEQEARRVGAKGVIVNSIFGCSFLPVDAAIIKDFARSKLGLPTLIIDSGRPGEDGLSNGQVKTRIEAFVESLSD